MSGVLKKDDNGYPVMGGVSSSDANVVLNSKIDPITGRLLVEASAGAGTVTSVSVVSANGFAGTVATATSTPAITISTTINAPVLAGNGTAISAATTTGSGSTVVLSNTPTLVTPVIGAATGTSLTVTGTLYSQTSLQLEETGAGTDTITIQAPASIAAPYTLTLPIDDGNNLEFLQTNGSGVLSWAAVAASGITIGTTTITSGTNTRILYDNAGVVGEYTITGSGTVVAMATAPTFVTSISTPSVLATANDSGALGASGTAFADLFLASGGVINWSAADATITHSAGLLTTNVPVTITGVATASGFAPTSSTATGNRLYLPAANTLGFAINGTGTVQLTSAALSPVTNDIAALGTTALSWSDLFLASGALINIANSNWVATHTSGILTVTTGDLRVTSANVGTNADSVPTLSSTSTFTNKTLTSPTIQTSPVLATGTNLKFTVPTADTTGTGITTNEFNSGYSSTAIGELVYLDSSATWQKADADLSAAAYSSMLGIALSVAASGAAVTVLLKGFVYASAQFPTFTIGAPVYMSATAAAVTNTAPVTTDSATRIVGYGVHADKMWFCPENSYITHT